MGEIKVRQLDDQVLAALKARAEQKGLSLEEEVRRTLSESVSARREALIRHAAALRAATEDRPHPPESDSVRTIREQRDAWG